MRLLLRWFPERSFLVVGDGNDGTHELARLGHRHHDRLAMVGKFQPQANLVQPRPATPVLGDLGSRGKPCPSPPMTRGHPWPVGTGAEKRLTG